jgi:hypothetical protein
MNEFQFEKNIEEDLVKWFAEKDIEAFRTRTIEDLGVDNIQFAFNYAGANEDTRKSINGFYEYDTHEGVAQIVINTYRDEEQKHHARVGQVRSLMLNHHNGFKAYKVFDIVPTGASHTEFEESNHDQTQLEFALKFQINFESFEK